MVQKARPMAAAMEPSWFGPIPGRRARNQQPEPRHSDPFRRQFRRVFLGLAQTASFQRHVICLDTILSEYNSMTQKVSFSSRPGNVSGGRGVLRLAIYRYFER